MNNFTIVGEIGEILVDMLKTGFNACGEFAQPVTEIALGTPGEQECSLNAAKPRIVVFLYHIDKSAHYENPDGLCAKLALELHYLVIAAAKDKSIEHKMAGKIAETLNGGRTLAFADYPERPGFAAAERDATVSMVSMTIDEKHKLWTAFPKIADKTFLPYVVRPVTIVCEPPKDGVLVREREYTVKTR